MLKDYEAYFDTEDAGLREVVERLRALVTSERLLVGLGKDAGQVEIPPGFGVQTDLDLAQRMAYGDDMYGVPEPLPFEPFLDVMNNSVSASDAGIRPSDKPQQPMQKGFREFGWGSETAILEAGKRHQVEDEFRRRGFDDVANEYYVFVGDQGGAMVDRILSAGWFGGIACHPVAERMLECLETGGLPCGWIGTRPREGGNARECMQMVHFGRQVDG